MCLIFVLELSTVRHTLRLDYFESFYLMMKQTWQNFNQIIPDYNNPEPFPKRHILSPTKLKEFADDNSEFDEDGTKFFNRVENAVGKGEIARYEQFLLFPPCFLNACTADT